MTLTVVTTCNALIGRRGAVFTDRYHSRALETRREVANAMRYVLDNYRKHTLEHMPPRWDDPWSSARFLNGPMESNAPVMPARTWLLRVGWRGAG